METAVVLFLLIVTAEALWLRRVRINSTRYTIRMGTALRHFIKGGDQNVRTENQ